MPAYFIFEVTAFILAIICAFNCRYKLLVAFVPYLLFIVLYEYGNLQGWFTINKSNHWAANIITFIEFLFYSFIIRALYNSPQKKKLALIFIVINIVFRIADATLLQGFWRLNSYSIILGSITIIAMVCGYFLQLMEDDSQHLPISKYPFFWMATGILFFYLGMFAFFSSFEYMAYKNNYSYLSFFRVISTVSNFILYSSLSIAFICNRLATEK